MTEEEKTKEYWTVGMIPANQRRFWDWANKKNGDLGVELGRQKLLEILVVAGLDAVEAE